MIERRVEREKFSGLYFSILILAMMIASLAVSGAIILLGDSALEKDVSKFISFSLSPTVILAVTLAFKKIYKEPIKDCCLIKKTQLKYYILAVAIFISVFFGLGNLNGLFIEFLAENFGYTADVITLPKFSIFNFVLVIVTLCTYTAFMEEIAMRGVILNGIKSRNAILNALICGLIFSLFHMNPAQTPYQFAVGFAFSLLAIKSGSILPSAVAHFLNNLAVVCIEYFFPSFIFVGEMAVVVSILGSVVFVFALVLLLMEKGGKNQEKGNVKQFFVYSLAGVIACVLVWMLNLAV